METFEGSDPSSMHIVVDTLLAIQGLENFKILRQNTPYESSGTSMLQTPNYHYFEGDNYHRTEIPCFYFDVDTNVFYRFIYEGMLLQCTSKAEALFREAYEGVCGAHQPGP